MNDETLVRAFQAGNLDAFDELFMRYQTQTLRTAVLITGNYQDSENILQETFIKCYQSLPQLKNPAQFKTWLYRILTRTAWAYCKKQKKEQPVEEIYDVYQASLPLEKSSLELMTATEEQQQLLAAVRQLQPKQKTVIVLYYYNEFSIEEIAKATGTLPGTVKSRLFTARHNLQKALQTINFQTGEVASYER